MNKGLSSIRFAPVLALALVAPLSAHALLIDANSYEPCPPISNNPDGRLLACGLETSQSAIDSVIDDIVGDPSAFLYKADDEWVDKITGSLAGSYNTTFTPNNDAEDALIEWITGTTPITSPAHLLIKDGNASPGWWLFSLADWNGTDDLELINFWDGAGQLGRGAISHVTIYGKTTQVPEPATLTLLGTALLGLALTRRRKSRA